MIPGIHFIYCKLKTDEPSALECGVRCRIMAEGARGCNAYKFDADTNSCSAAKVRCRIKDAMHITMMLIQTPALLLR